MLNTEVVITGFIDWNFIGTLGSNIAVNCFILGRSKNPCHTTEPQSIHFDK